MKLISIKPTGKDSVKITTDNSCVSCSGVRNNRKDRSLIPVELMTSSLGACIVLMIDEYCKRNGYKDGDVSLSMTYEMGGRPIGVKAITVDLELPKDVPAEKHIVIERIAKACPVHATLQSPPEIDIEIL